jgi:hypothetical protein
MLNRNKMLESDKMGATCALSVGNHQFDATAKVRQNASEDEFRSVYSASQWFASNAVPLNRVRNSPQWVLEKHHYRSGG